MYTKQVYTILFLLLVLKRLKIVFLKYFYSRADFMASIQCSLLTISKLFLLLKSDAEYSLKTYLLSMAEILAIGGTKGMAAINDY